MIAMNSPKTIASTPTQSRRVGDASRCCALALSPRPPSCELCFLEIRGDVDVRQWHQRQKLGSGLDVLADLPGAVAGHSRYRRADHRMIEVVLGEPQIGPGLLEPCFLLALLRLLH